MIAAQSCSDDKLDWVLENTYVGEGELDLKKQDFQGETALNLASKQGYFRGSREILDYKVRSIRKLRNSFVNLDEIDELLLSNAIRSVQDEVQSFINLQNTKGKTPLVSAVKNNHPRIVKLLFSKAKSIDIDLDTSIYDKEGNTALGLAVKLNKPAIASIILEYDSDKRSVNIADNAGKTPLQNAIESNNYEMSKLLLKYGANISPITSAGKTFS